MAITQKTTISIGALVVIIPLLAGAVIWYDDRQTDEHAAIELRAQELAASAITHADSIDTEQHAGNVELTLQQIELELKLLRTIQERRELTPDEKDRKEYLEALREIIVAEQRKAVA